MIQILSKIARWVLKTFLYGFIIVFGLVIAILLFSQTGLFRSFLRSQVVSIANEQLNAVLNVEEIEGNFFSNLTLKNVTLSLGDTSVVAFEELGLTYDAFAILDDQILVHEIRLVRPKIYVQSDSLGNMNLQRIAKPGEPKPPAPIDSSAKPLGGFDIRIDALIIEDGNIVYDSGALLANLSKLNLNLQLRAASKLQKINISQLGFLVSRISVDARGKALTDSLQLKNLTLLVEANLFKPSLHHQISHPDEKDSNWIKIEEFRLLTNRTDFFVKGEFVLPDSADQIAMFYDVDTRAYPLHLDDIRTFADIGLTEIDKIELEAHARGNDNEVELTELSILTPAGTLKGTANLDYGGEPLGYRADLSFNGINAAAFTGRKDLYANINGSIHADGVGIKPEDLISVLELKLYKSQIFGIDIEKFEITSDVRGGIAQLKKFEGRTSAGNFNCEGFYNLLDESYHLETRFREINIADAIGDTSLQSSINLSIVYDGKGLNPKTSRSVLHINSDSSKIMGRDLENLSVRGSQNGNRVYIDGISVKTPLADFSAKGSVGMDSTFDLSYELKTRDFSLLKKYVGNDSLLKDSIDLNIAFKGRTTGGINKFETSGDITLTKFAFADIKMDSLKFVYFVSNIIPSDFATAFDFRRTDSTLVGDFLLYSHHLTMAGTSIKNFSTSITKEKGKTHFDISAEEDNIGAYAHVKGVLELENEKKGRVFLDNLVLNVTGRTLKTREVKVRLGGDPVIDSTYEKWNENWQNSKPIDIVFDIEKNIYDFRSFNMDIGRGSISAFGTLDITGDQNLDIKIKDLDLSRANALIGSKESVVEGILNMNGSLKGSFEKPILLADWNISDGKASEFVYNNFLGNMQYLNRKIQVNMTLNQNKDKTLTIGGYLPIDLSFKDVPNRFTTRPMNFKIHSEGIDLRFLQAFFGKGLSLNRGELMIDLKVTGNKEKPSLEGEMKVEDATVTFPRTTLGQTFRNGRMFVRLTPEKIFLDTLSLQSGKDVSSNLFASGQIDLSPILKNFDFTNIDKIGYDFDLLFNEFVPINTKSETSYLHTAKITGAMKISAPTLAYTVVKGDIQIRNSQIWVVDAAKARSVASVSAKPTKADAAKEIDYYKNLDLDIAITLPENSENVIRSNEMMLGLFGGIIVTKPPESEDFFISGNVNTKKGGKYAYLSIAFNIEKGEIVFSGAPGINPDLDILAVKRFTYKIDQEEIQSEAQIKVSGKLMKPEIAVTAVERGTDNPLPDLTEPADILSYLVLGVKTKDLGKLDASQAGDFAKQVAINQVLNVVANQAGLSKLEYTPSATGQGATIEVGKRISENISVSFAGGSDPSTGTSLTLEMSVDSWVDSLRLFKKAARSWKKTVEFEYKQPAQTETNKQDVFNIFFYFKKEY